MDNIDDFEIKMIRHYLSDPEVVEIHANCCRKLLKKIDELQEYKFMYEGLCK